MDAWIKIRAKYELTTGEELRLVSSFVGSTVGSIAKYAIREERHGSQDKPGGCE